MDNLDCVYVPVSKNGKVNMTITEFRELLDEAFQKGYEKGFFDNKKLSSNKTKKTLLEDNAK